MNLKTILIVIICVLIGFAVVMLLGYFGIVPFDMVYGMVTGWISGFNMQEVIENPASIATIAGTGITTAVGVAVPLMSKVNSAKQQAEDTAAEAKTKIKGITGTLESTTSKLQTTELNLQDATTKLNALEPQLTQYKTQADTYKTEFDKLQNQYKELQKITGADVIGNLPAGTIIPNADGSKTVVIEKTVVK
jgi:uncharacterized phage infection (PIP) family protein YhgE